MALRRAYTSAKSQQSPLIQSSLIQFQIKHFYICWILIIIWIHIKFYSLIDTSHLHFFLIYFLRTKMLNNTKLVLGPSLMEIHSVVFVESCRQTNQPTDVEAPR